MKKGNNQTTIPHHTKELGKGIEKKLMKKLTEVQ